MSTSRASVPEITRPSLQASEGRRQPSPLEELFPKHMVKGVECSFGVSSCGVPGLCLPHVGSPWHGCKNRDDTHRLVSKCASYFRGATAFSNHLLGCVGSHCRVLLPRVRSFVAAPGFSGCGFGGSVVPTSRLEHSLNIC